MGNLSKMERSWLGLNENYSKIKQLIGYFISIGLSVFFLSRIVLDLVNNQPFSWRNVIWGVFFFQHLYRKKHLNKKLEID